MTHNFGNNFAAGSNKSYASYLHAIEWVLTGDPQHADKAMEIINAWSYTLQTIQGSDQQLLAGIVGFKFCNAAELIKHTSNRWPPAAQYQFKKMMREVFYPLIKSYKPGSNGNWDASMILTTLCIGIFTDDRGMYEDALK